MTDEQMDRLFDRMEERFKTKEPYWNVKNIMILSGIMTGLISSVVSGVYAVRNNTKIDSVQTEAAEVKTTLDAATKKQEKSLENIEDAIGPTLLLQWKVAQQIADDSGLVKDQNKANEAKAKYDAHVASQKASGVIK